MSLHLLEKSKHIYSAPTSPQVSVAIPAPLCPFGEISSDRHRTVSTREQRHGEASCWMRSWSAEWFQPSTSGRLHARKRKSIRSVCAYRGSLTVARSKKPLSLVAPSAPQAVICFPPALQAKFLAHEISVSPTCGSELPSCHPAFSLLRLD
jgi:hypothetical protein